MSVALQLSPQDLPFCDVCQKPVQELRSWYDYMLWQTVYEARCHGAVERCELTDYTLAMADSLRFGVAFKRVVSLLPEPTRRILT